MSRRIRVPDTVDHYAVDANEQLGQGSYGIVFQGRDTNTGQQVAIKCIKPPITSDGENIMKRIENELELLRSINHPNIVRLLHYKQTEQCAYMVLELCTCNLQEFATENELPEQLKMDFIRDFFQAIQHLHNKGIIHRDIKPDNALVKVVDGTRMVKVTDFGLSRRVPDGSSSCFTATAGVGTKLWMAPEVFLESDIITATRYSKQADTFSVGLLAGSVTNHTPREILQPITGMFIFKAHRLLSNTSY